MDTAGASGLALEATSQDILTRVTDIQTKINDGTAGLVAIKNAIDVIDTNVDSILTNTVSIESKIDILDTNLDTALVDLTDIKGVGFATADDSLKAISDRVFTGGEAV